MDMHISGTQDQQPFRSPPRRRRSTFFERRVSLVPQHQSENDLCKESQSVDSQKDMAMYYENLLKEKTNWKREVTNRRNKYHDLRQEYETVSRSSSKSRVSFAALTSEDVEFLKAKPNIVKLAESQQKLHNSLQNTRALFRRVNELDEVILCHNEELVNKVTQHILDNSSIGPVD